MKTKGIQKRQKSVYVPTPTITSANLYLPWNHLKILGTANPKKAVF